MGNKFPIDTSSERRITGQSFYESFGKSKVERVYLNTIKRQYRIMANYLQNNEPNYVITKGTGEAQESQLVQTRAFLDNVFTGQVSFGKNAPFSDNFYDTIMDDVIYYGLMRGFAATLCYFDTEEKKIKFRNFDPMDIFFGLNVRRMTETRQFLFTYIKSREQLQDEYPNDSDNNPIDWEDEKGDTKRTDSPYKPIMQLEPDTKDTYLLREGYYLEYKDKKQMVVRVVSSRDHLLEKQELPELEFLPLAFYIPMGIPDALLPRSWFGDMLEIDKEINKTVQKLTTIANTSGRFVFVRKGTKISKATNNVMNQLGVEVLEVDNAATIPQQAQILTITQDLMTYLTFLLEQSQKEGGMMNEITGSTDQADASGRAIMALQAGSKNNIGSTLQELNKYMTVLTKTVLKLHQVYGEEITHVYSKEIQGEVPFNKAALDNLQVKVTVVAHNAFDEITKRDQATQVLTMIKQFSPEAPITPEMIANMYSITNDFVTDLEKEIDKQSDPDMVIADAENKKMIAGQQFNANQSDDHQKHMAMHSQLLQSLDPKSPVAQNIIMHMKQHEANMAQVQGQSPAGFQAPQQ